jgi:hypothetical protein
MNMKEKTCESCGHWTRVNGVEGHCSCLNIYKRFDSDRCSKDVYLKPLPVVSHTGVCGLFKAETPVKKGELCSMKKELKEGVKFDEKKLRVDLIPVECMLAVAQILTHGAKKYDDNNWKKGIHFNRVYRACLGHLFAYHLGLYDDEDSGLPHLWHALCNLTFLVYYDYHYEQYREFDNLPRALDFTKPKHPDMSTLLKSLEDVKNRKENDDG